MPKPCRLCEKKRYANQSFCYLHWKAREKAKRLEKLRKKNERRLGSKKYEGSQTKFWNNKCWKLMSLWVRTKDADQDGYQPCYTCDAWKHYKDLQAGHRHHRRLDYDERNIHPQCRRCNMKGNGGLDGNLGEYEHRLTLQYGVEWTAKLKQDANTHPGYRLDELKTIYAQLQEKISRL